MNLTQRLLVFGGGALPRTGLKKFFDWVVERENPRLLVIAWASEQPAVSVEALSKKIGAFGSLSIEASLFPPTTESERGEFIAQLRRSTGVFFSGGDQNRIGMAIAHEDVRGAIHDRYAHGVPFAGTSAGTAIMSTLMFGGDRDPGRLDVSEAHLREGLGLCEGVLFDQHFLRRQRQNRLFSAILRHAHLVGIGVDEDTGLAIVNGRHATVVGPEKVMRVVKGAKKRSLGIELYDEGEEFDLLATTSIRVAEAVS